jgi:hypothetical protein
MSDDLTGLTAAEKKLLALLTVRATTMITKACDQVQKDVDEVSANIDRRLAPIEEALK